MNGILQNYFLKNQIKANSNNLTQKPCMFKKNLSFTRNAVNPIVTIPGISGKTDSYIFTDISSPDCRSIGREADVEIVKNGDDTVELKFKPSKCHNEKELYQMFSAALYTAIKRAQKTGAKEVTFLPYSPNEEKFAFDAGFKKSQSNTKKLFISAEHFKKIIGNLEKTMLKNVAEMTKVDKVSDKFKINRVLPDNKFLKKLFPSGINNLKFYQTNGNCYFLAALKAVSKNPYGAELIAKMIELTPDKKYKVTFPGFPKGKFHS